MDNVVAIIALAGIVGAGLVGGSLFAFSTFVMPALRRLPDAEGIRAMQQINRTVYTPWFMVPFFATSLLAVAAVALALLSTDRAWWPAIAAGGALFTAGLFGVTAFGNVPLNKRLEAVDAEDTASAELWQHYLIAWTRLNHVRSIAAPLAVLMFGLALYSM